MSNEELWKATLGELELSLSKANFETWFHGTTLLSRENGVVHIGVRNIFTKEWLENRYNHLILQAIQKHDITIHEIFCEIASQSSETHIEKTLSSVKSIDVIRKAPNTTSPVSLDSSFKKPNSPSLITILPTSPSSQNKSLLQQPSSLNPRYTFENFIVGENNELARAACWSVSQNPGTLYNPLFIYGVVGIGKTHLLQSIGNEILRNTPEKNVLYTTSERFTNELIESLKNQKMNDFKAAYQDRDVLLIDDVQFLSGREKTQQEFFHIFNNLYLLNKQIVITSDRTPKAIPTLEDRLKSRFEGGMIADISRPDFETRIAILHLKLAERNFPLDEDCIRFIAENITNNIRELEGALNRIIASSEFQKIRPTVSYIQKVLEHIITETKRAVTLELISKVVADFYHVEEEELRKKGRKKEISSARQIAMHLARTELELSLSAIGKYFGGRDHTTVLHACDRIRKNIEDDSRFKEEFIGLREHLYRE